MLIMCNYYENGLDIHSVYNKLLVKMMFMLCSSSEVAGDNEKEQETDEEEDKKYASSIQHFYFKMSLICFLY